MQNNFNDRFQRRKKSSEGINFVFDAYKILVAKDFDVVYQNFVAFFKHLSSYSTQKKLIELYFKVIYERKKCIEHLQ